jgi:hypothetical protein
MVAPPRRRSSEARRTGVDDVGFDVDADGIAPERGARQG